MSTKKATQKSANSTTASPETSARLHGRGTSRDEGARQGAEGGSARNSKDKAAGERDVLAKIAEMREPDRALAERLHAIITASAPELAPKTWYGMPAYARDGKIVCFFTPAPKFSNQVRDVRLQRRRRTSTTAPCGRPPSR